MTSTSDTHFGILQHIFADIANDLRRDPLEHMLILTYEFDDQQLLNLLSGRNLADNVELQRNQLKFIADMQPVVIYDARKTRDSNALPHFLDLLPVNPGAWRCHHAKAYLFVTRNTVRLILGSFNLTRTGLFENREVFADFLWSENSSADLNVLRDFSRLLRDGYEEWTQTGSASSRIAIADTLDARLAHWQPGPVAHTLITSGYSRLPQKDGLSQLATLWKTISNESPRKLLVVSPFFDRGDSFLIDALSREVGRPNEIHFVTDEINITKLGQRHYGSDPNNQVRKLTLIPAGICDAELKRISRSNENADLKSLEIRRILHAKILVLCGDKKHLVYCGSANFTLKAWNGDNQELGVASISDGTGDARIAEVLSSLAVGEADAYARLMETVPDNNVSDDEDYADQPAYPNFVSGIRLEKTTDGDSLAFKFLTKEPEKLQEYIISWGVVELAIDGTASQAIPHQQAYMPLVGGRNLRFVPRTDPTRIFLLPFFHEASLTRQQDLLLFSSAEDWMRHYLNPESLGGSSVEFVPGENNASPSQPDISVDRGANVVIAMQHYLNLFSAVEKAFHEKAQDLAEQPPALAISRARTVEQSFLAPLQLYARLLKQEYQPGLGAAAHEAYHFRLGELVLLCSALTEKLPELASLTQELASQLDDSSKSTALTIYVKFVQEKLLHA